MSPRKERIIVIAIVSVRHNVCHTAVLCHNG